MPSRQKQRGFTLVELIVTMSVMMIMLFLINELFQSTSVAVTTSVQTSKAVATNRSINEQLSADAEKMVGPDSGTGIGGYIVIIQQQLPNNIKMLDPQNLAEVEIDGLRSDQLVFIRDAQDLKSMTPARDNSYATSLIGQSGDYAKVYYGHVLRAKPDGSRTGTSVDFRLGGDDAGHDRIASNFILGRQAMLFNPPALNTGADVYADNAYYASDVQNITGFTDTVVRSYMGLTDVTSQAYGPGTTPGTLLEQLSNGIGDIGGTTDTLAYLNTAYRFADNRLRVNPAPDAGLTNYASWAIAQTHPILAQGCSEIIIDFAADLDGDGQIDTAFGGQSGNTNAPIFWYDGLKRTDLTDGTAAGTTGWTPSTVDQPWVNLGTNAKAFIFRADDDTPYDTATGGTQAHSYWPYLIRIRYRLHDTRGRLTSNEPNALRDGLDNDGDGDIDEAGGDVDEDQISGRWFERIIRVKRPE
ncbi:MAG: prepilin-type N-terminal cleavage/methylation domain-containing protein [Phycisphaeraceae bacterium]|nr:prepilin-type N-terminal cleavage/methylation domain-containing protein [Phycisphaeraceae bacterium]